VKRLRWLTSSAIFAIHQELIAQYGGIPGLRAPASLESAIARPKHMAAYKPKVTVPALAAAYAWGLLRNHPFTDGNKRIALATMVVFLDLNGWELSCTEAEETAMVLQAAAGKITESDWNLWVAKRCSKKPR
jgi:death on curing protein